MREQSLTSFAVCGASYQSFFGHPQRIKHSDFKAGISHNHRVRRCLNLVPDWVFFLHFQSAFWGKLKKLLVISVRNLLISKPII